MSINIVKDDLWKGLSPNTNLDEDVPLILLFLAGKLKTATDTGSVNRWVTTAVYADKAFEWFLGFHQDVNIGCATGCVRWTGFFAPDPVNYYFNTAQPDAATADYQLWKMIAGSTSVIGTEAVDLTISQYAYTVKISCLGTSIKAFREDRTTPKISVTDSSLASGNVALVSTGRIYIAAAPTAASREASSPSFAWLRAPATPSPKAVAFFEMPIVGEGSMEKPFTVEMPEEIVEIPREIDETQIRASEVFQRKIEVLRKRNWTEQEIKTFLPEAFQVNRVNRLAITHSTFIPSVQKTGKPIHGTAIVQVYESASPESKTLEERIQAVKSMKGARRLKRDEAIDMALKIDDKLFIHDLMPCAKHPESPTSKCCKEQIEWREKTIGLKRDLIADKLMAYYVKEDKW